MSRAGLPVPPGFTLPTARCREYFAAGRKWPPGMEDDLLRALAWLEGVTDRRLGAAPRPLLGAVRSGAAVSLPGMMDTVLNVGLTADTAGAADYAGFVRSYAETVCGVDPRLLEGAGDVRACLDAFRKAAGRPFPTDPWEMLTAAVTAVLESWESERAARYRARHGIEGLAGTAVTVQAMFPSERSGVLFTEDPNRPDSGQLVIEAAPGLGEAVVRGHAEPDVYRVERSTKAIAERRGTCLTDGQVAALAVLGLAVEAHFGTAVDVEWGWADGRAVLLQSRPIRGLDVARAVPKAREEEIARLRGLAAGRKRAAWAIHNLSETLPAPTPLTWDLVGGGLMTEGFVRLYRDLGYRPSDRVARDGFLELVAGRIYMDADRAAELFFGRFPLEYDFTTGGPASEMVLDRPTRFNLERAGLGFLLKLPYYAVLMIRAGRIQRRAARRGLLDFAQRTLPAWEAWLARAGSKDLERLEDAEVLAEIEERRRATFVEFGPELLKPGFLAAWHHGRLAGVLESALGRAAGRALVARLLSGLEGDSTVESNIALWRVARGERPLEGFLSEYGHRAVNELELAEPRWSEDPGYVRQRVRQLGRQAGASPAELHEKRRDDRREAEDALGGLLREAGASSLEDDARADLEGAQRHMPWRETCKHHLMKGVALIRAAIETLARRWGIGRDIYFLRRAELAGFVADRPRLVEEAARRKIRWQALQRLPVPEVLLSDALEALGREERLAAADGVFEGRGVAAGVGTGPARVLSSPDEAGDLDAGYVLVCSTTDPGWTPLFIHAAGLVVERGGMLSHGAIVARDFGIPAVVLPHAMRLIREGARVKVDGNLGVVSLSE